jgi:hypothetical protein
LRASDRPPLLRELLLQPRSAPGPRRLSTLTSPSGSRSQRGQTGPRWWCPARRLRRVQVQVRRRRDAPLTPALQHRCATLGLPLQLVHQGWLAHGPPALSRLLRPPGTVAQAAWHSCGRRRRWAPLPARPPPGPMRAQWRRCRLEQQQQRRQPGATPPGWQVGRGAAPHALPPRAPSPAAHAHAHARAPALGANSRCLCSQPPSASHLLLADSAAAAPARPHAAPRASPRPQPPQPRAPCRRRGPRAPGRATRW